MSEIKQSTTVQPPPSKLRYLPPSKRTEPIVSSIDMTSTSFPELNTQTAVLPKQNMGGFKQKILDLIAREEMDELEKNRLVENDPTKMTTKELLDAGWDVIPLSGDMKERYIHFNERMLEYKLAEETKDLISY